MLLVAFLRQARGRALTRAERGKLAAMIRRSSNRAAGEMYRRVGDGGLRDVARAARMRRLGTVGYWSDVRITAADQARLFFRLNRVLPPRHRAYARALLQRIVPDQRWGIPAGSPPGFRVMFKGGWRRSDSGRLVHQVARVERPGGPVVALCVLTDGSPSHHYGTGTVRGIAERLLAGLGS
jgi:hypothetical protein